MTQHGGRLYHGFGLRIVTPLHGCHIVMLYGTEMEMALHARFLFIFIHSFLILMSFHHFDGMFPDCKTCAGNRSSNTQQA